MSNLRELVGIQIRSLRKSKGLTQQELAELSNLDDAYIGAVERGERNFSIDTLEKIMNGLQVQPMDLMRFEHNSKQEIKRQDAISQFIAMTSNLSIEQIDIIQNVNRELKRALK